MYTKKRVTRVRPGCRYETITRYRVEPEIGVPKAITPRVPYHSTSGQVSAHVAYGRGDNRDQCNIIII